MISFLFGKPCKRTRRRKPCNRTRRRRSYFKRSSVAGSCSGLKRPDCLAKPFCNYVRGGQGCKYIPGGRALEAGMLGSSSSLSSGILSSPEAFETHVKDVEKIVKKASQTYDDEPNEGDSVNVNGKWAIVKDTKRDANGHVDVVIVEYDNGERETVDANKVMKPTPWYIAQDAGKGGFGRRCGSRRKSRKPYNVAGSPCNNKNAAECKASGCTYTKRGCRRKATYKLRTPGVKKTSSSSRSSRSSSVASSVPKVPKVSYKDASRDLCRLRKTEAECGSNPNCTYTKSGCRRRSGVVSKGLVFEGPVGPNGFGRRRSRKVSRKGKKLPKAFVKKCRKYGIKTTIKRGKKRVAKKMSVLKKQLRRAMRAHRRR